MRLPLHLSLRLLPGIIVCMLFVFTLSTNVHGRQPGDTIAIQRDTVGHRLPDSTTKPGSATINQEDLDVMSRNLNSFVQMQKEREAKQKRQAIIRIAIGVGFFILLIVGWRRRRKVKGE